MKRIHIPITFLIILALSSCNLKSAPVIGGFFPTEAGMGMSFHPMTVSFDNFKYEEIEVK